MDRATLISLSLLAAACGVAALTVPLLGEWRRRRLAARTLDSALARQGGAAKPAAGAAGAAASGEGAMPAAARAAPAGVVPVPGAQAGAAAQLGARLGGRLDEHWLDSRLGRAVVSAEDQRLLEQCGWHGLRARVIFGMLRLNLPALLAVGAVAWHVRQGVLVWAAWGFATFAVSYLAPKHYLRRHAATRSRSVEDELPVLIDMLRLLQGVGLSIDQSLQIIVSEFGTMLRVLGPELALSNQQFASGRSREQTLLRIGRLFDSENLKGLITLLTQVDRHGGAVQEPLRLFGQRMQEARKSRMKEEIGRLTVKMTSVMVVSMLPVLLIITAGPGFLGVIRMLAHMGGTK